MEIVDEKVNHEFKDMGFPTNVKLRMAITEWHRLVQYYQIPLPPDFICPNPFTKEQFLSGYDFTEVDKYAISRRTKSFLTNSVKTAVNILIRNYQHDEVRKFRVIFRWYASLDLSSLDYREMRDNQMIYLLFKVHNAEWSIAELIEHLCLIAKIPCVVVKGLLKHEQFNFGKSLEANLMGSWNAVRLNGFWFLCNANFASRSVNEDTNREHRTFKNLFKTIIYKRKVTYSYNDFYFLTNPEEIVYDHHPINHKEQLLPRPVSDIEFKDMVNLWQTFFELKLGIVSHPKGIIIANFINNEIIIQTDKSLPVFFSNQLYVEKDLVVERETFNMIAKDDVDPQKFVAMFQDRDKNLLIIRFRMPQSARYKFRLYSNKYDENMTYLTCLDYIINFTKENVKVDPFPRVNERELGPNYKTTKYNFINMTPALGMYYTSDSFTEIRFEADDEEFDIYVVVTSLYHNSVKLQNYCISTFEHGVGLVKFFFPSKGEYGINIHAKRRTPEYCCSCLCFKCCEKDEPDDPYYDSLCSYIAVCTEEPSETKVFSENRKITIGKRTAFLRLGLNVEDNFKSYQECSQSIQFKFLKSIKTPCQFRIELFSYTKKGEKKDCSKFAFMKNSVEDVKFFLNFPYEGLSRCFIYGKKLNSTKKYKLIYICCFDVLKKAEDPIQYPLITDKWRISETHKIIEPLRNLYKNETVKFQITGIKCQKMVGRCLYKQERADENCANNVTDDSCNEMINFNKENDIWTGSITTDSLTESIIIEIKVYEKATFFTEILRYTIFNKSEKSLNSKLEEESQVIVSKITEQIDRDQISFENIRWCLELGKFIYLSEFIDEERAKLDEEISLEEDVSIILIK